VSDDLQRTIGEMSASMRYTADAIAALVARKIMPDLFVRAHKETR
jgi:hypothetical protein